MSARDELSRICGPVAPPELTAAIDAFRAEVLREAADWLKAGCPDGAAEESFMLCQCDAADHLIDLADGRYAASSSAPAAGDKQPELRRCDRGHELSGENTLTFGRRIHCKTCLDVDTQGGA